MGTLYRVFEKIRGAPPVDFQLIRDIEEPDSIAGRVGSKPLKPGQVYLEVYVESFRLKRARKFATRFHGMIYSFFTLARAGMPSAEVASLSKPNKLAELDPDNLDRVITVEQQVMGRVPWRGGVLKIELGLFSIKSGNLLSPVLDYVTRVGMQGGISFLGQVKPFLPLITEGLDLIAGQTKDVEIEVALDTDMNPETTQYLAIVAVPKSEIDTADLSLDPTDFQLLHKGRPLDEAYCVISLRASETKPDYGDIPELAAAFEVFRDALGRGKAADAQEALDALTTTIRLSADLIDNDKNIRIAEANDTFDVFFPGGLTSKRQEKLVIPQTLYDLAKFRAAK
ncbi:MAG: hypothetical protein HKN30_17990 [Sulfitobacter sp.]|nr:hypothetical protein [Sulfitobacter sp.]